MNKWIIALLAVVVVVIGVIVPIGYPFYLSSTAFSRGADQAREELSAGKVGFKLNGLPNANAQQLFRMLKEKGIAYSAMDAGEYHVFKERSGYNSVMVPVIRDRYGIDVPRVLRGEQPSKE